MRSLVVVGAVVSAVVVGALVVSATSAVADQPARRPDSAFGMGASGPVPIAGPAFTLGPVHLAGPSLQPPPVQI